MSELLDDRPWGVGQAVGAVLAGLAAAVAASLAVGPEITDAETFRVIIPSQALVQVALIWGWASQSARRRLSLGWRFEGSDLVGIPIGVGFQIAASLALLPIDRWVLHGDTPTQDVVESASGLTGFDIALVVIGAGLLAPLAEELVFRGILLRALLVRRGPQFATYVTAGVFAGIHLLDPSAWLVVPVLFVFGVLLAKITISSGRLSRALLAHMAFNLLAVAALFLA
jgi:membrane protease YdiL (CAAX protease family)